ncbi:FHA domain-containing protein [Dokdonella sp.]|uniref:FHA domain-containing protein n=1 Tax=Dokdonella sp. TaxID=2291710 RepID=UPI001B247AAC|nr:FHA domain-containing protein [Dokdonella sp.]MBO9663953.1 FHA domain-containing protein [Dokdonella sp.]
MRLSFSSGEYADFVVEEGAVSLGQAEGNTFVLTARDVAAHHARLTVDARGAVLEVLDPQARTHVNARPVREKALLRSGDVLCLGQVMIALKADRDDLIDTAVPPAVDSGTATQHPPRVILRGVSGSHFGKTVAVHHRLTIGNAADCGLVLDEARVAPRHAAIEHVDSAIYLRSTSGRDASVNGVRVRDAVLHPGDQIAFERSHFVIEAPGLPLRGSEATDPDATQATGTPERRETQAGSEDAAQGGIWWLIGAAAAIAAGIALMIWRGAGA